MMIMLNTLTLTISLPIFVQMCEKVLIDDQLISELHQCFLLVQRVVDHVQHLIFSENDPVILGNCHWITKNLDKGLRYYPLDVAFLYNGAC